MWEPYRLSIEQRAPNCRIVYDKFHIMQHANAAIDEVRRAEFFRKGARARGLVKGKRWLLLSRWVNLTDIKRQELNTLFSMNRRLLKAYLLKESLDRLWFCRYEGAMIRYLNSWMTSRISEDWERMYAHPVHLLETFVDPQRFRGTCYRAANWILLGYTTGRGKNDLTHKPNRPLKHVARVSITPAIPGVIGSIDEAPTH
jgi:hypothetical protein